MSKHTRLDNVFVIGLILTVSQDSFYLRSLCLRILNTVGIWIKTSPVFEWFKYVSFVPWSDVRYIDPHCMWLVRYSDHRNVLMTSEYRTILSNIQGICASDITKSFQRFVIQILSVVFSLAHSLPFDHQ